MADLVLPDRVIYVSHYLSTLMQLAELSTCTSKGMSVTSITKDFGKFCKNHALCGGTAEDDQRPSAPSVSMAMLGLSWTNGYYDGSTGSHDLNIGAKTEKAQFYPIHFKYG